jgi:alanine dehydrogenase
MELTLGAFASSRKPDEYRLPIHPRHLAQIDPGVRARLFLERGYGDRFGFCDDQLRLLVAGMCSRETLVERCDVCILPKPTTEDLASFRSGGIIWGWPHCVQDETLTQLSIDRRLTMIAWESMNYWKRDGSMDVHVFHKNNELAGYCSVMHALQLTGTTGDYGRHLSAAVIGFGATGRGAVTALNALGILNVAVITHREVPAVASPIHSTTMFHFETDPDNSRGAVVLEPSGPKPFCKFLAGYDIVVNCILQDTDSPRVFVSREELRGFASQALIVDVSCDASMGFEWAHPTSFAEPMMSVGPEVNYYAVDHSPSYLWNSATWEISEALLPFLSVVASGPDAWKGNETIRRAIEIREGVIQNPKILTFQKRSSEFPHRPQGVHEEDLVGSGR